MPNPAGIRRTSLPRHAFEVSVGLLALVATLVVHVSSFSSPGAEPEGKARVTALDPALLKAASTDNPCTAGQVALTFDDGPGEYTEPVLDVLRAYGVKATFFVLGSKVSQRPETIRTALRDGHLIENHTWDHPHLTDLTPAEIEKQISRTQRALRDAGAPAPTMLRAPFNNRDETVRKVAAGQGLRLTQWDIDTNDWRGRGPADIADAVVSQVRPGSVVLLHDGIQDPSNTLNALPAIITGIRGLGYCTATLS